MLHLILKAKPSRVSYVTDFKLDETALDRLPPSLSWYLSTDMGMAAGERRGLSWKKFKPGLKMVSKGADWIEVEEPDEANITVTFKAFGDFNGDGIEDVLLFMTFHVIGGTMRYYEPALVTRTADGGRLKVLKIEDREH